MNKLTPEAEAMIRKNFTYNEFSCGIRKGLTDPELLKAQGLFTKDEVRTMLIEAYKEGSCPPYYAPEDYADIQLDYPEPPKTEP